MSEQNAENLNITVNFDDLCRPQPKDQDLPLIDRDLTPEQIDDLTDLQHQFRMDGVLHVPKLMPDALIDSYVGLRSKLVDKGGWNMPCPYLHFDELREISLYRPMMEIMNELIGYPMALHLNLTGWVSTERNFHQDDYLNPSFVNSHYMAVWIALDDIHVDSGPFQFVRGSHRWPVIRQERVFDVMRLQGIMPDDPLWPTKTQDWIAGACEKEIKARGARVEAFLPRKGDVLFWHGRLIHRGSKPQNPDRLRKSLICHYSSVEHRPDFPSPTIYKSKRFDSEGLYFDTKMPLAGEQRV